MATMNSTGVDFESLMSVEDFDGFVSMQSFMVEPVGDWTTFQKLLFPWLFIIPAEILGLVSSLIIYLLGDEKTDLPYGRTTHVPLSSISKFYIWFNRLLVLPFLSLLIVKNVWASDAVLYKPEELTWANGLGGFAVVFALADFTYYASHRFVHAVPAVYKIVHKHHHGESEPIRGWADTCNAHPLDFFYTGFCTSPLSVLWLMPASTVHIYAIGACLWINSFVGSLGHCRLDLNVIVFDTRFHAGHHAKSTCNFAQNIEIWDRLFGTFQDHKKMMAARDENKKAL